MHAAISLEQSAIERLTRHNGGPIALSRTLGNTPSYQQIQSWCRRKWASPLHIARMLPLLPGDMTEADLHADRERFGPLRLGD